MIQDAQQFIPLDLLAVVVLEHDFEQEWLLLSIHARHLALEYAGVERLGDGRTLPRPGLVRAWALCSALHS